MLIFIFIKVRHFNLPAVRWVRCAPSRPFVPRPYLKTTGNVWLSGINCLHLFRSWITGHVYCLQISFVNPSSKLQICTLWNLNCLCMRVLRLKKRVPCIDVSHISQEMPWSFQCTCFYFHPFARLLCFHQCTAIDESGKPRSLSSSAPMGPISVTTVCIVHSLTLI
jgi:hypothetical protein